MSVAPEKSDFLGTVIHANRSTPEVRSYKPKTGLILAGVTGGIAVGLSIVCLPFVTPAFRRICLPYVPATTAQVENVLGALRKSANHNRVLDIGSGDGRIVLAAAKAGYTSHGVELNPWLIWYSRLQALRNGLSSRATFSRKDLWKFDFSPYPNVVIFGVKEMMTDLEKKLIRELPDDGCVIACRFPLQKWNATYAIGEGIDTVWLYHSSTRPK